MLPTHVLIAHSNRFQEKGSKFGGGTVISCQRVGKTLWEVRIVKPRESKRESTYGYSFAGAYPA